MARSLLLIVAALAAVAWLMHQPAYLHATHHKQAVAVIAVAAAFFLLDILLSTWKKLRGRARSAQSPARTRARVGAGR